LDIMQSKNRCETDSISLQRLHSKGFGIPLFKYLNILYKYVQKSYMMFVGAGV
jgi:hypothetical protein